MLFQNTFPVKFPSCVWTSFRAPFAWIFLQRFIDLFVVFFLFCRPLSLSFGHQSPVEEGIGSSNLFYLGSSLFPPQGVGLGRNILHSGEFFWQRIQGIFIFTEKNVVERDFGTRLRWRKKNRKWPAIFPYLDLFDRSIDWLIDWLGGGFERQFLTAFSIINPSNSLLSRNRVLWFIV